MVELLLICPQAQVEPVCALLDELQAVSLSVEDADACGDDEQALYAEPGQAVPVAGWPRSRIAALFNLRQQASLAMNSLTEVLQPQTWGERCGLLGITDLPEQDWVRLTQAQFVPLAITPSFWIVPSWHSPPEQADTVMRLDPGLAFGTGTHPTTRMCLQWIASRKPWRFSRVLDYGCGSGVLAIAAALHGASSIDALDIDPLAVEAARGNALSNRVTVHCALADAASGAYDLILANILATPLRLLAPLLCSHLQPGAPLLLSGILERQCDELAAAYRPWVDLRVIDREDGWILMSNAGSD